MSRVLSDTPRAGCYMVEPAAGPDVVQEEGIFASGNTGAAGLVLGMLTASDKLVPFNPAGVDGSETVAGILYDNTDASDADVRVAYTRRNAAVNGHELVWPDGISAGDKTAAEKALADTLGLPVRY